MLEFKIGKVRLSKCNHCIKPAHLCLSNHVEVSSLKTLIILLNECELGASGLSASLLITATVRILNKM